MRRATATKASRLCAASICQPRSASHPQRVFFESARARAWDTSALAANTEAKGYRALVRYQEQRAASPATVPSPASGFDWGDAFIGAGLTLGVFLLGAAAAITLRRRQGLARLRS
jgi:hypothetical protein